jgi:hypothetical protein
MSGSAVSAFALSSSSDVISAILSDFGSLSHLFGVCRFSEGSPLISFSMMRYLHRPFIDDIALQMLGTEYPLSRRDSIKSIISALEKETRSLFFDERKAWNFLRSN